LRYARRNSPTSVAAIQTSVINILTTDEDLGREMLESFFATDATRNDFRPGLASGPRATVATECECECECDKARFNYRLNRRVASD